MMRTRSLRISRTLADIVKEGDPAALAAWEFLRKDIGIQLVRCIEEEGAPVMVLVTHTTEPGAYPQQQQLVLEAQITYFRPGELVSDIIKASPRPGWLARAWRRLFGRAP